MTSAAPILSFKGTHVGYGKTAVVHNIHLTVHKGDFWGILGHNGAGKSTVLKTLLGLIPPVKGEFTSRGTYFGRPRYGYVPQKEKLDAIYPLTAFEVAAMGTYRKFELLRSLRGRSHNDLLRACLKQCGALELTDKRYSDLSGGQRQRVLIARALAAEPELLVLDEPLAGIDVTTQTALLKLFAQLKAQKSLTVLMVSHRVQREKDLFTHVAWVGDGKVETGATDDMLSEKKLMKIFETEL